MRRLVLGVTGGVGAGKSTVLKILKEEYQAHVIEADEVGRRLEQRGQPGYQAVVREFGGEILDGDGEIDRGRLAKLVFSDPEALRRLNGLLHPMIYEEIQTEIRREFQREVSAETQIGFCKESGKSSKMVSLVSSAEILRTDISGTGVLKEKQTESVKLFVLEAAILFETGFDRCCDATVYVRADEETRIARLRETRGYSREKAQGVIANQLSDKEFLALADFVIENSGDLEETRRQIQDLMTRV